MNIKTFIDRPVLSSVISIVIVIGGLIGLAVLPIERYPNIAPPTIRVQANYTGASAETVQKAVVVPLEEAINGVENMTYMTSSATNNGSASIQVFFKQGTNADMAAVNVQNCVSRATRQLPSEVTDVGVRPTFWSRLQSSARTAHTIVRLSPTTSRSTSYRPFRVFRAWAMSRCEALTTVCVYGSSRM